MRAIVEFPVVRSLSLMPAIGADRSTCPACRARSLPSSLAVLTCFRSVSRPLVAGPVFGRIGSPRSPSAWARVGFRAVGLEFAPVPACLMVAFERALCSDSTSSIQPFRASSRTGARRSRATPRRTRPSCCTCAPVYTRSGDGAMRRGHGGWIGAIAAAAIATRQSTPAGDRAEATAKAMERLEAAMEAPRGARARAMAPHPGAARRRGGARAAAARRG